MDKLKVFFLSVGHLFERVGREFGVLVGVLAHVIGKDELTKAVEFVKQAAINYVEDAAKSITAADANTLRREWVVGSLINSGMSESKARILTESAVQVLKHGAEHLLNDAAVAVEGAINQ